MTSKATRLALLASALLGACNADPNALDGNGGPVGPEGSAGASPGSDMLPCDIATIVSDHCTLCHSALPRYGAPMPLMSQGNFHAPLFSNPERQVFQRAAELLHSPDPEIHMPPPGTVPALDPAELDLMTRWLSMGAPTGLYNCAAIDPEAPKGAGGAGFGGSGYPGNGGTFAGYGGTFAGYGGSFPGNGGTFAGYGGGFVGTGGGVLPGSGGWMGVGGEGPVGAGGAVVVVPPPTTGLHTDPYPGWDADPDLQCHRLVAHNGDKQSKYVVGTATDKYMGFSFMPPWTGTRYVRSFRKITDNAQVLHHWLLFQQSGAVQDGAITPQLGAHPDGQLLHGWAPGGSDVYLSPDVGVEMSGTRGYLLELHYNSRDAAAQDASGVEVCTTGTRPANVAGLSWLGTDAISSTTSTGTCNPRDTGPIRILAGTPHMHLKGRHMRVVINRAAGGQEVAHDEAFSFENQRIYPEDLLINPGDTITTTCTFSAPASFGPGTNQEMCYWFALHYPALSLSDGAPIGTLVHGANSCLGL